MPTNPNPALDLSTLTFHPLHPMMAVRRITLLSSTLEELSDICEGEERQPPDIACTLQLLSDLLQDCFVALHPLAQAWTEAENSEEEWDAGDEMDLEAVAG